MKPDPSIFKAALDQVQRSPDAVLFIDDRPDNIEGAKTVGIRGIVFQNEKQFKEQLKSLGLWG